MQRGSVEVMMKTVPIPEVGQAVRIRNRLATVRAVEQRETKREKDVLIQ